MSGEGRNDDAAFVGADLHVDELYADEQDPDIAGMAAFDPKRTLAAGINPAFALVV